MQSTSQQINARVTDVARASYGRLIAILSVRTGDILGAEDALGDAFKRALEVWPKKGIPDNPEAWIFSTARNRLIDIDRKNNRYSMEVFNEINAVVSCERAWEQDMDADSALNILDDRIKLLFVCAHPAIDSKIHTPLMLQTVLGLDVQKIASAFLVSPTTMAQRLVRAKRKIRDAEIPFIFPGLKELPARLDAVLEAIYGAFSIDWMVDNFPNIDDADHNLSVEAFFLINLLASLLPDEPEVLGLSALMHFSNSRVNTRFSNRGEFVPLDKQDTRLWEVDLIEKAEKLLMQAHGFNKIGRFQLEAAIQAVHCNRWRTQKTDWGALAHLYEGLQKIAPTVGGAVARAVAIGEAFGAEKGLACLDQIEIKQEKNFQPIWATRAYLLAKMGEVDEAIAAYEKAVKLTTQASIRRYLLGCCDKLSTE